ncbi:MAG: biotin synthase BioB [Planctomycetota bacterium]
MSSTGPGLNKTGLAPRWLDELGDAVLAGRPVQRDQAVRLISVSGPARHDVIAWGGRIRRAFKGDRVHVCSIVNARCGRCSEDCSFCSQSVSHNTGIETFDLLAAGVMVERAREAARAGARCFGIVTSGRGPTERELPVILDVVRAIRNEGLSVCASLGVLSEEAARQLHQAGVRRYNHNLETSRNHFPNVCTTHAFDDRVRTVEAVRSAGLEACCGGILGLGETPIDRVDMALELARLGVESVPVNVLMPIPGTRSEALVPPRPLEVLHTLAVFRMIMPRADIKLAGGRESALRELQSWMFAAGANGFILGNYLTTRGRSAEDDLAMIEDLELDAGAPASPCPTD